MHVYLISNIGEYKCNRQKFLIYIDFKFIFI